MLILYETSLELDEKQCNIIREVALRGRFSIIMCCKGIKFRKEVNLDGKTKRIHDYGLFGWLCNETFR